MTYDEQTTILQEMRDKLIELKLAHEINLGCERSFNEPLPWLKIIWTECSPFQSSIISIVVVLADRMVHECLDGEWLSPVPIHTWLHPRYR